MADEFSPPFFSQGVYGQGIIFPRLEYRWMVGNNNSNLDVAATKLDRKLPRRCGTNVAAHNGGFRATRRVWGLRES